MFMTFKATRLEITHASLSFTVALDPEMLHSAVSTLLQQPTFLMPSVLSETLNGRVIATVEDTRQDMSKQCTLALARVLLHSLHFAEAARFLAKLNFLSKYFFFSLKYQFFRAIILCVHLASPP